MNVIYRKQVQVLLLQLELVLRLLERDYLCYLEERKRIDSREI